jgi:hypothetical protein
VTQRIQNALSVTLPQYGTVTYSSIPRKRNTESDGQIESSHLSAPISCCPLVQILTKVSMMISCVQEALISRGVHVTIEKSEDASYFYHDFHTNDFFS